MQKDLRPDAALEQRPRDRRIEAAHRADGVNPMRRPCGRRTFVRAKRSSSHGVTVTAMKNENSIAIEALAGIGLIYGPIRPDTNIIGRSAATMVSVATMVGLPTSATACDRGVGPTAAVVHRPVARNVLDDDDRVVDEDADREDEREQADAVDGVAHQPGGEEREQDRRRDDDEDDEPLAPADGERDEDDDRDRRKRQDGRAVRSPSRTPSRHSCA